MTKISKTEYSKGQNAVLSVSIAIDMRYGAKGTMRVENDSKIEYLSSFAGGYGYDMESQAVADMLNASDEICGMLRKAYEQAEKNGNEIPYGICKRCENPTFMGAIGMDCYTRNIFPFIGLTMIGETRKGNDIFYEAVAYEQ